MCLFILYTLILTRVIFSTLLFDHNPEIERRAFSKNQYRNIISREIRSCRETGNDVTPDSKELNPLR